MSGIGSVRRYAFLHGDLAQIVRAAPSARPSKEGPGSWVDGTKAGLTGIALLPPEDLWDADWAPELFEVEYRGEAIDHGEWISAREVRVLRHIKEWNEGTLRLFACDCIERRGLRYYHAAYPDDDRVQVATATARRFARGKATVEQLNAARDAALTAFEAIGPLPENLVDAPPTEWVRARAKDAVWATVWAASRDEEDNEFGTFARRAARGVLQASCRNPAGWIAAKVVGRDHLARFLAHLHLPHQKEGRPGAQHGRRYSRYGLQMDTFEVVDVAELGS